MKCCSLDIFYGVAWFDLCNEALVQSITVEARVL